MVGRYDGMSRRLPELDIIRAGTAMAVVAIHVTAGYMDLGLGYYWNHFVRFAVPLFILLSGMVLFWNDSAQGSMPAQVFYQKRLEKILVPYISWTLIYSLVNAYLLRLQDLQLFLHSLGKDLIWGSVYYHLYFITIIMQLYLLYPFLRWVMVKYPSYILTASFLLTATCQVIHYLNLLNLIELPARFALLYLRAFPVWIFYFVFGMFVAQLWTGGFRPEIRIRRVFLLGIIWFGCLALMILDSRVTGIYVSIVRPTVILYAVSSYWLFLTLAHKWGQISRHWLAWLSMQSFLIYLMHPLVLTVLDVFARKIGQPGLWKGSLGLLLLYGAVTTITIFLARLISRTPLAGILGGVRGM